MYSSSAIAGFENRGWNGLKGLQHCSSAAHSLWKLDSNWGLRQELVVSLERGCLYRDQNLYEHAARPFMSTKGIVILHTGINFLKWIILRAIFAIMQILDKNISQESDLTEYISLSSHFHI